MYLTLVRVCKAHRCWDFDRRIAGLARRRRASDRAGLAYLPSGVERVEQPASQPACQPASQSASQPASLPASLPASQPASLAVTCCSRLPAKHSVVILHGVVFFAPQVRHLLKRPRMDAFSSPLITLTMLGLLGLGLAVHRWRSSSSKYT